MENISLCLTVWGIETELKPSARLKIVAKIPGAPQCSKYIAHIFLLYKNTALDIWKSVMADFITKACKSNCFDIMCKPHCITTVSIKGNK